MFINFQRAFFILREILISILYLLNAASFLARAIQDLI